MDFGQRLRELRTERGENQSVLAEHLGVSGQSYSAYENGREPSYSTLCTIAKYFNVTADYLLGLSDARKPENAILVNELGLSEQSIHAIHEIRNQRSDTVLNQEETRTMLDVFNQLLGNPVFYGLFLQRLVILTSPSFLDVPDLVIPGIEGLHFPIEPMIRSILDADIDKIIEQIQEETKAQTNSL